MKKISKIFKSKLIKENKKSLIVLSVIILLALVALIFQKSYAFEGANGTSGDCNWTIDTNGKMVIAPPGVGTSETKTENLNIGTTSQTVTLNNTPDTGSTIKVTVSGYGTATLQATQNSSVSLRDGPITLTTTYEGGKKISFQSTSSAPENLTVTIEYTYGASGQTTCTLQNQSGSYNSSPWYSNSTDITSVEVKPGVKANTNASYLFYNLTNATSIDVRNLDTSNVSSMTGMFYGCYYLTNLYLGNKFVTNNVKGMSNMFASCSSLTNLDVSNFNTSNVTMSTNMFAGCSSLTSLDLSNFNTSNVTNMNSMFSGLGSNKNEGTKLTLNNTFNKTYSTSENYRFPYEYYAKETNGVLDNRLYTLSEMQTEVTSSSTPTTWVPAYQVSYDKGSGDSVSGTTPQIYRIGSKINTNGLLGVKNNYDFTNWNNSTDGTGDLTINKDGESANSYGDKYASVGTNNVLTLYAQYEETGDPVVMKDKDNNELDKNGEGLYIVPNNKYSYTVRYITDINGNISKDSEEVRYEEKPLGFLDTPKSGYRFLMMKCDKGVTLDNGKTILPLKPMSLEELKKIKVKENLVCNVYHKPSTEKTMQCE